MKTTIKSLLVLILAGFVFIGCASRHGGNPKKAQLEYKTVRLAASSNNFDQQLNEAAQEGWKLVTVMPEADGYAYYTFERAKH
jgi:hypothetical protein